MPVFHSSDTLTFGSVTDVHKVGEYFADRGITFAESHVAGNRKVVTVTSLQQFDLGDILAEIVERRLADDVRPVPVLFNGTYGPPAPETAPRRSTDLPLLGKGTPHMLTEPTTITSLLDLLTPQTIVPAGGRRPVIAVLDSGVRPHPWLATPAGDPFVIDAESVADPWPGPPSRRLAPTALDHAAFAGHGTFIAGILRREAPNARVLSVRVAGSSGWVDELTAIDALEWLIGYHQRPEPVDVVLMAFGREPGDHGDRAALADFEEVVGRVRDAGMRVVASAGNDGGVGEIYPAAWETVTAVGSGTAGRPDAFSNYGAWVDEYRPGGNVESIFPPDQWASWTGTSFAVPKYAAELVRDVV